MQRVAPSCTGTSTAIALQQHGQQSKVDPYQKEHTSVNVNEHSIKENTLAKRAIRKKERRKAKERRQIRAIEDSKRRKKRREEGKVKVKWHKEDLQKLVDLQKQLEQQKTAECTCHQCSRARILNNPKPYVCPVFKCPKRFNDFVSFFEHQVDAHGTVYPKCRRVFYEVYNQEHGKRTLPPATVFIGEQFLNVGVRPTKWSMERVDIEYVTLPAKIFAKQCQLCQCPIWPYFLFAYERVQQGGLPELELQYRMALEYYNSSLTYPVGARNFHDGSVAIGKHRNWLVSADPEYAEFLNPLRFSFRSEENEECENEIVLMDTNLHVGGQHQQEGGLHKNSRMDLCNESGPAIDRDDEENEDESAFNAALDDN